MTTITIKNGNLSQTDFNSAQDLFVFLRNKFSPIQVFAIDEDSLSQSSLDKINASKNNPQRKLTDFQGWMFFEEEGIVAYIKKRNLIKPYLKAKRYMEQGFYEVVDLRKRKPKSANIFYFKIDKKFRAIGYIKNDTFIITEISDHQ